MQLSRCAFWQNARRKIANRCIIFFVNTNLLSGKLTKNYLCCQSLSRDTAGGKHVFWNKRPGTEEDGCHTVSKDGICCLENYDLSWDHRPGSDGQPSGSTVEPAPGEGLKMCEAAGNCVDKGPNWVWQPISSTNVRNVPFFSVFIMRTYSSFLFCS